MLTFLVLAILASAIVVAFTRSPGRRRREDDYEQRFGPLG